MSESFPTLSALAPDVLLDALFRHNETIHAIVDGAAADGIADAVRDSGLEYSCLFAGDLEPDLANAAPYIVRLAREDALSAQLSEHTGKSMCLWISSDVGLAELRRHFRQFLTVRDTQGRSLYFRLYDPRVLPAFLRACDTEELRLLFGPVRAYLAEDYATRSILQLELREGVLVEETLLLDAWPDPPFGDANDEPSNSPGIQD